MFQLHFVRNGANFKHYSFAASKFQKQFYKFSLNDLYLKKLHIRYQSQQVFEFDVEQLNLVIFGRSQLFNLKLFQNIQNEFKCIRQILSRFISGTYHTIAMRMRMRIRIRFSITINSSF